MRRFCIALLACLVGLSAQARARAAEGCTPWTGNATHIVHEGDITFKVRTIGAGTPVIFIPALGRGVDDFDPIAAQLAQAGFLALLPDPRGIGGSDGSLAKATLDDLAQDVLRIAHVACAGPAFIVGHAFGGRIAARAATLDASSVRRLAILAVSATRALEPDLKSAMGGSAAQGFKSRTERLLDLQKAYFAKGNDAHSWLDGWYPFVASSQNRASNRTGREDWSNVPTEALILIGESDIVGTHADAEALADAAEGRVTLLRLPQAGRALLPEQPEAIAAVIIAYFKERKAKFDDIIRAHLRTPAVGARGASQEPVPRG